MNLRLVALARQILYFALFASGLRRRNSSLEARRAAEMAQRFSLTIGSALLVAALVFTSAIVRSVVLQSTAGLWSFAAFFAVGAGVVFGMRPLGVASFWSPRALPPDEWEIMSALKGAGVGRGQLLHRLMVTRLAAEFGGRFGCVLVDMHPTALSRIPTPWSLDDAARAAMRRHFTSPRWAGQRRQIEGAFAAVGEGRGGGASVESCLARPPLF